MNARYDAFRTIETNGKRKGMMTTSTKAIWLGGAWCVAATILSALGAGATADERPDVLMIAVDDLRPMLGCYGDPRIQTPNIDRLAERGIVFERAYCQYAKCGPSRLSIMTGLRPGSIRILSNSKREVEAFRKRRSDAVSVARWFRDHGYHAQSFGKIYHDDWDLPTDWSVPSSPGREKEILEIFDEAHPGGPSIIADRFACPVMQSPDVPDDHLFAGRMTTSVLDLLETQNRAKPLFLAVGYRRPHLPFVAPKRYFDLYAPDDSWLAPNPMPTPGSPVMAWFNSDGYGGAAKRFGLEMPKSPTREEAIAWNGFEMRSYLGVPEVGPIEKSLQLDLLHAYAACVTYVDAQIGRLLSAWDDASRERDTIIVLWADHGWHLGEQSAWGKMTNFEIATRVPLIVAAPGIEPGRTRTLAELVDLYPTLCELAGLDAPPHLEGETLLPVLLDPAAKTRSVALSEYPRFGDKYMGRAMRTARYRFVAWSETESGRVVEQELYDHVDDPNETRNLAQEPDQAARVERLQSRLNAAFQLAE